MLIWWKVLILVVVSYFCGNVNFARIFAAARHLDITKQGSGNPGAMNMTRTLGLKFGILTFLLDMLKTVVPCLLGGWFLQYGEWGWLSWDGKVHLSMAGVYIAGISAILGHMVPVVYRFKGGKGIAASAGFFFVADWRFALGALVIFALIFFIFRYGSIASLVFVTILTVVQYVRLFAHPSRVFPTDPSASDNIILLSVLLGVIYALIIFAHRKNIKRLITGSERRLNEIKFDTKEEAAASAEHGVEAGIAEDDNRNEN